MTDLKYHSCERLLLRDSGQLVCEIFVICSPRLFSFPTYYHNYDDDDDENNNSHYNVLTTATMITATLIESSSLFPGDITVYAA